MAGFVYLVAWFLFGGGLLVYLLVGFFWWVCFVGGVVCWFFLWCLEEEKIQNLDNWG